ncbi:YbaB/EbfC family nucleoid-associated protein [Nocardia sp. NPDC019395]|uniref:YbaB/EbfC family nucleoid-associated protein n=1 Tax=Nocardia sp. NPDC019395 TaxID=3154686 RepID=UPI0033D6FF5A
MISGEYSEEAAAAYESLQRQMGLIAEAQRQRVKLTASASVRDGRVTATVNADGLLIETIFADDIDELSYAEIAAATTEATQQAAAEVARKSAELVAPLREERAGRPKLSEMLPGLADVEAMMPVAPPVPTVAPDHEAPEDDAEDAEVAADPVFEFENVEEVDRATGRGRSDPPVSGSDW